MLVALDRAAAFHPRQHPLNGRSSSQQSQSPRRSVSSVVHRLEHDGERLAVRDRVGDPVDPQDRACAATSWSRRARRPRAATSPTSSPTASRISAVSTSSALSIRTERYGVVRKKSNASVDVTAATRARGAATDDRDDHDDEHQDEREVGVVDLVAQRDEQRADRDRREPAERDRDPGAPGDLGTARHRSVRRTAIPRIAITWVTRSPCRVSSRPLSRSRRATSGSGSVSAHFW